MPVQLSVAVATKVTVAPHTLLSLLTVMFEGQVIAGACVSFTVTVKVQVVLLLDASVAVAVTVVVPIGNTVPGFCE